MAMLLPPPTKPITLPWQHGFSMRGKKKVYTKPCTERREVSYGKIMLMTVAVTQDLLSGMPLVLKIELIRLWNSILPEPGQPSAKLSKLICLTACKKAMDAISQWNRTVYIPWLVASYDTHKGKHLLHPNPPNHSPQGLKWPMWSLKSIIWKFNQHNGGWTLVFLPYDKLPNRHHCGPIIYPLSP